MSKKFVDHISDGYKVEGKALTMGAALLEDEAMTNTLVEIPLSTLNRHGLIAGATGTGKTKTLQGMAEALSDQGVPVLLMDMKGDLSGLAYKSEGGEKLEARMEKIGIGFEGRSYPVEFLSLSDEPGIRLRATVSEFGPILFSRILELNDTQTGILAVVFKYCDDRGLLLLDLKDLKEVLQYLQGEGQAEAEKDYGKLSSSSMGTILRKIVALEQQGAADFFGEKSFDVDDLLGVDQEKMGYISILRLADIQDRPVLFSTFMLSLLAEVYGSFPEIGDPEQPELVIFIDEAHLIFKNASKALMQQLESIIKLIRSKGVGIFFCTQNPNDLPEAILAQLGLKVQHALRAFTAKDRKAIKLMAENFPISDYYEAGDLLTSMGIGEAMVTGLDEKGRPTPLVHTLLCAPKSLMGPLTDKEVKEIVGDSDLAKEYDEVVDRESAYEILSEKFEKTDEKEKPTEQEKPEAKKEAPKKRKKSVLKEMANSPLAKQVGRTVARELTRGLLGAFGIKTSGRRRRRKR